jgi:hypothetical protein
MAGLTRPRRRKERKLMTMEEVNERFPLTKYKVWRASREQKDLSTAGGVTLSPSRAASIRAASVKDVDMIHDEGGDEDTSRLSTSNREMQEPAGRMSTSAPRFSTSEHRDFAGASSSSDALAAGHLPDHTTLEDVPLNKDDSSYHNTEPSHTHAATVEDDAENDPEDPIHAAVPPELADAEPGDACAICLDNLELDDEIRGLTCGHAFHAGCLDPWLTGRRACCPLCKADYWIPKPRPDPALGVDAAQANLDIDGRMGPLLTSPAHAFIGGRGFYPRPARTFIMGGRFATVNDAGQYDFRPIPYHSPALPSERTGPPTRGQRVADFVFGNPRRHLPFYGEPRPARASRRTGGVGAGAGAGAATAVQEAPVQTETQAHVQMETETTPSQMEAGLAPTSGIIPRSSS